MHTNQTNLRTATTFKIINYLEYYSPFTFKQSLKLYIAKRHIATYVDSYTNHEYATFCPYPSVPALADRHNGGRTVTHWIFQFRTYHRCLIMSVFDDDTCSVEKWSQFNKLNAKFRKCKRNIQKKSFIKLRWNVNY